LRAATGQKTRRKSQFPKSAAGERKGTIRRIPTVTPARQVQLSSSNGRAGRIVLTYAGESSDPALER
jgi:hypothetical protein